MNGPNDPVEDALRGPAYLDDGDFTNAVMAALPPRRRPLRGPVLVGSGIAAGLLGAVLLGEPVVAAGLALGTGGVAGAILLGTALAAAAGALAWSARQG